MARLRRFVAGLFFAGWLLAHLAPHTHAEDPKDGPVRPFEKVLEAWDEWKAMARRLPLSKCVESFKEAGRPERKLEYEFARDGDYYYYRAAGVRPSGKWLEHIVIWNPRYRAAIERYEPGMQWRVVEVVRRDKSTKRAIVDQTDAIDRTLQCYTVPFVDERSGDALYRIIRSSRRTDEKTGYKLHCYVLEFLVAKRGVSPEQVQASAEVVVAEELDWLPVQYIVSVKLRRNPDEPWHVSTSSTRIEGWKKVRGVWKWTRMVEGDPEKSRVVGSTTWAIPGGAKPLDHGMCFLSHYGLPEPVFEDDGWWQGWIWLIIGGVLVVGAVAYLVTRKR